MKAVSAGRVLALWAVAAVSVVPVGAVTPLTQIKVSSDTTVSLGGNVVDDETLAADNLAGTVTLQSLGAIPREADLDAYAVRPNGAQLLSFDTTVVLPGGTLARAGDIVRYDGVTYSVEFNAAARGIPDGVNLDAVAVYGNLLLMSFDGAFDVGVLHVEPADLVLFDGAAFSKFFDGVVAGVGPDLNLDGVDYLSCDGHLLLSFDGSGSIGGVAFGDEDALEFDRVGTWEPAYQGSAHHANWSAADLDAVHATVNLGAGTPVVFGQTVVADANKTTFRWPASVSYRSVRGSFGSSADIGAYAVNRIALGSGTSIVDASTPNAGSGFWYLVKPGGCTPTSWQSTLGAQPGRDLAIP
jgi:hypothetical protein